MRILLILPPMTQLNTPYPATAYLTAWLRKRGHDATQCDLGIELALKIFSRPGFERMREALEKKKKNRHRCVRYFLENYTAYFDAIEPAIRFLQNKDPSLALQISSRNFLPEGHRFASLTEHAELLDIFGDMGTQDKAKYIASLFLDDIADVVKEGIDPRFQFSRYGESLAASQNSFDQLQENLTKPASLIDEMLEEITKKILAESSPELLGLSVPFPGNVYGALRIAKTARELSEKIPVVMGGGYVNTELREITDTRLFDYIDYLLFDDGERPLECLLEYLSGTRKQSELMRTKICVDGKVLSIDSETEKDPPFKTLNTPTYDGLPLADYISMMELPNPMHRLWSDFRWNKLILAHGC